MKSKLLFLVPLLLLAVLPLAAQRILIEEDLRGDTIVTDFGMNRKHYFHNYLGVHFPVGSGEVSQADVAIGRSWTLEYGFRYKRRYSQTFSGGLETVFKRSSYHPERFLQVDLPEGYDYNREKFVFLSLGMIGYQRINLSKKRGNYIGRFVDIGAYGDIHYNVRHIMRIEGEEDNMRIRRSHMGLHELFSYGVIARVGLNNFVLKASYRLSDTFKAQSGLPDFTPFMIGLEFGMHPL